MRASAPVYSVQNQHSLPRSRCWGCVEVLGCGQLALPGAARPSYLAGRKPDSAGLTWPAYLEDMWLG